MAFLVDTQTSIDSRLREQMFRLRKRVFCDTLGWDIPHHAGQEADIYDFNASYYLNWLRPGTGELLGSVRLMPFGGDNLMTTVFQRSHEGERSGQLRANRKVWEGTRLCINEDSLGQQERGTAMICLLMGLFKACQAMGIETLLCNCGTVTYRLYRTLGLEIEHVGVTKEFRHGAVHCLAFGISGRNFEVLADLASRMNLEWPVIAGEGIALARTATRAPTRGRHETPSPIPAPAIFPQAGSFPLHAHA